MNNVQYIYLNMNLRCESNYQGYQCFENVLCGHMKTINANTFVASTAHFVCIITTNPLRVVKEHDSIVMVNASS